MESKYLDINRESWNNRVETHLGSDFYRMEEFLAGWNSINDIEAPLLGEVSDRTILHLQCHFGQDTLSLARMGAKVTGIDLSDEAIEVGRSLAKKLNLEAQFHATDVYSTPDFVKNQFDIVFTSYGTIGWLPDLDKWAKVIVDSLKPGGTFVMAEFHPVVWMFDNDFNEVKYTYFKSDPIEETEDGTYADTEAPIKINYISWNHGLGEVVRALQKAGLVVTFFNEYDYSPYPCFKGTVEVEPGKHRIEKMGAKIPLVYALKAVKA